MLNMYALAPETQAALLERILAYSSGPRPGQFDRARELLVEAAKTAACAQYLLFTAYLYGEWGVNQDLPGALALFFKFSTSEYLPQMASLIHNTDQFKINANEKVLSFIKIASLLVPNLQNCTHTLEYGNFIPIEAFCRTWKNLGKYDLEGVYVILASVGSPVGISRVNYAWPKIATPTDVLLLNISRDELICDTPGVMFAELYQRGFYSTDDYNYLDVVFIRWCTYIGGRGGISPAQTERQKRECKELAFYVGLNRSQMLLRTYNHIVRIDQPMVLYEEVYNDRMRVIRPAVIAWLCCAARLRICKDIARLIGKKIFARRFIIGDDKQEGWLPSRCVLQ